MKLITLVVFEAATNTHRPCYWNPSCSQCSEETLLKINGTPIVPVWENGVTQWHKVCFPEDCLHTLHLQSLGPSKLAKVVSLVPGFVP